MKSSIAAHTARAVLLAGCAASCLTRPLVATEPATHASFTQQVASQTIDKIDLLFDVDNSRSMGDKQTVNPVGPSATSRRTTTTRRTWSRAR
jgi:hypothetical protein